MTTDTPTGRVLVALGIPAFTLGTDFTGALMLATPIEAAFGVDISTTQWVLNVYALTFSMGLVSGGRLADMFGRRRLLGIGLALFVLSSLGCALAPSVGWLIGARAAQGIGGAFLWPSILALAAISVPAPRRAGAIGIIIGCVAAGNVAGPVLAGVAGGLGEWRLFFVFNVTFGALSVVLVRLLVPRDDRDTKRERVDLAGMLTLAISIFALLYALDVSADWEWDDWRTIGLLIGAGVLLGAFLVIERWVADPMVPPALLRNLQFMMALAANGLIVPALFICFLYMPQYLNKAAGWSILHAAIGMVPLMVCLSIASFLSGRLYAKLGPRVLTSTGYGLATLGCLAMLLLTQSAGYLGLLPTTILVGIGAGLAVTPAGSAAVAAAGPARFGLAGGLSFMVHLALGAIGVAGATAIITAVSAAHLARGLDSIGVTLSAADQTILNGSTAKASGVKAILDPLGPGAAEKVGDQVARAFTVGVHRAFLLPLGLAAAGLLMCLFLNPTSVEDAEPDPEPPLD